jgi:hypothetical protein
MDHPATNPNLIHIQIKSVSTQKEHLEFYLSNYSKIADLKYMIFIEDEDHPPPEAQKLILFGRIPLDHEMIESLLGNVRMSIFLSPLRSLSLRSLIHLSP